VAQLNEKLHRWSRKNCKDFGELMVQVKGMDEQLRIAGHMESD
jgi:hypothetical protein